MRIRTIKPEFWSHPVMARLPDAVQLLALALLSHADDHGYFNADAAIVRGSCMPFREDLATVSRDLRKLVEVGWIELREHPEQGQIGHVAKWEVHQRVDHPKSSKLKGYFDLAKSSREPREVLALEQGTGNREQGTSIPPAVAAGAGEVLKLEGEEQKPQATTPPHALPPEPPKAKKPRERDPLFDALAVACGNSPHELTKTAARECAVALAEIRSVSPGLTSAEIHLRSANYRSHFPDAACTAFALAKHWARCGEQFRQTPQQLRPAVC